MKRTLILLASVIMTLMLGSTKANAQSQDFFVRVGAGANYYWGEDDSNLKVGPHLSPNATITLGKWFNPYCAIQLNGNYGKINGASLVDSPYGTGEPVEDPIDEKCYKEKWNYLTIQPEVVYNISNGICGYNEHRVWNMLFHVGFGYAHSSANSQSANSYLATMGMTSTWRLCRNVQLWASGRFYMLNKGFDKVTTYNGTDGLGNLSAGISFNFGK